MLSDDGHHWSVVARPGGVLAVTVFPDLALRSAQQYLRAIGGGHLRHRRRDGTWADRIVPGTR